MGEGIALAEARLAVERIAEPAAQQVEWSSRREVTSAELAGDSLAAVGAALADPACEFSPLLGLRLEALASQLDPLSLSGAAPFEDSDWTLARHLAQRALREASWSRRAAPSGAGG